MKKYCLIFFAVLFGIAIATGSVTSLYAQEGDTDEFMLEEITVTAQKRAENQQKVAISMDVISGEDLAGTGKDNVDDILSSLSNVQINNSSDGMRVTVRGLAEENTPFHDMRVSTPTVAINVDGAYNSGSSAGQNLFDIERVEVLAGPQSTLYGSNSPGGIVNVVTAAPKTEKFSANATAEFGNFGTFNGQVMVNVPVVQDLVAMRLAANKTKRDSWIDGADNSQDNTTVRLKTLYKPSEIFSANLTLNWSESAGGGRNAGEVELFNTEDGNWVTIGMDGLPVEYAEVTDPWTVSSNAGGRPGSDAETNGISAEIAWDTGIGALTIVPSYSKEETSDYDPERVGFDGSVTAQLTENHTEQKAGEVRLASPADFPFKWIVGGTYYESDRVNETTDDDNPGNNSYNNSYQENKALYANITYPLTDTVRGTLGYRRSWDKVGNTEIPAKVGDGITGQEYSNPDYKVGIEYDVGEDSMLYANYATSYRVNGMAISQATGEHDKTVPPEELKSYSIGVKNRFFDNRLQLNASAYYYDYQNKNFDGSEDGRLGMGGGPPGTPPPTINEWDEAYHHTDPETGEWVEGTDFNNDGDLLDTNTVTDPLTQDELGDISDPWIQQFGDFESIGVDISADMLITSKDRLNLSLSYMQTEWTKAVVGFYWSWLWDTEGMDYAGEENTFSPTWTAKAAYQHNFELGDYGTLVPQIDVQYKSKYKLSFATDLEDVNWQEAHYLLNGSVTYSHISGRWSLNAYVKNATDYAVKTFWMNMGGRYAMGLNDPRTYGAVLSLKF
jgi:iron complex outermembrane receptor protein